VSSNKCIDCRHVMGRSSCEIIQAHP
jgi:hypothetical protein